MPPSTVFGLVTFPIEGEQFQGLLGDAKSVSVAVHASSLSTHSSIVSSPLFTPLTTQIRPVQSVVLPLTTH
jgi:hypothetical protein